MSEDRIQQIKDRLAVATPGPWVIEDDGFYGYIRTTVENSHGYRESICGGEPSEGRVDGDAPDTIFIAHAPEDIAYLLGEVERLRSRLLLGS